MPADQQWDVVARILASSDSKVDEPSLRRVLRSWLVSHPDLTTGVSFNNVRTWVMAKDTALAYEKRGLGVQFAAVRGLVDWCLRMDSHKGPRKLGSSKEAPDDVQVAPTSTKTAGPSEVLTAGKGHQPVVEQSADVPMAHDTCTSSSSDL
ncbi:MAG: hypothetical protein AAF471_08665 [Myxococcota bacterium]